MLRRLTPASLNPLNRSTVHSPGFASSVISQPGSTSNASAAAVRIEWVCSAVIRLGVPPPKKMLCNGRRRCILISATTDWT